MRISVDKCKISDARCEMQFLSLYRFTSHDSTKLLLNHNLKLGQIILRISFENPARRFDIHLPVWQFDFIALFIDLGKNFLV